MLSAARSHAIRETHYLDPLSRTHAILSPLPPAREDPDNAFPVQIPLRAYAHGCRRRGHGGGSASMPVVLEESSGFVSCPLGQILEMRSNHSEIYLPADLLGACSTTFIPPDPRADAPLRRDSAVDIYGRIPPTCSTTICSSLLVEEPKLLVSCSADCSERSVDLYLDGASVTLQ